MARGKRNHAGRGAPSAATALSEHHRVRAHVRAFRLESYEVGGCVRDELGGREAKDVDIAVCGLSYDQLETELSRHGFVEPNIVGGGKLGLRLYRAGGPEDGELIKLDAGRITGKEYRAFYEQHAALGRVEPEVYDGEGQLVGCRLFADWAPEDGLEISLARTERSTATGRANFETTIDPSLSIVDDLRRRDFTINAMARNLETGELIDPFGGADDLQAGILRTVTPESFQEDPSRIIRGLVRIAKDDLVPEPETLAQMREWAHLLPNEPAEQIYNDMEKLFSGRQAAKALRIARDTGVLATIIPQWGAVIGFAQESKYHDLSCDDHILLALERACELDAPASVKWAALLHDIGKPASAHRNEHGNLQFYGHPENADSRSHEEIGAELAREALAGLKQAPKELEKKVAMLVREHMYRDDVKIEPYRARKFIRRIGRDSVEELMLLRRCDRAAKSESGLSAEKDAELTAWEQMVRSQLGQPLYVKELAIGGHEAMRFGLQGPKIGAVLEDILIQVVAKPEHNERERLLGWLAKRAVKAGTVSAEEAEQTLETLRLEAELAA